MRKRIVILGSNFAGFTCAHAIKCQLRSEHDVVVISSHDELTFSPSLIWVPFGLRDRDSISFPVRPSFESAGITFKQMPAQSIDLKSRHVLTAAGIEEYDYLVIATGAQPRYTGIPGLAPADGFVESITTWDLANHARLAFEALLRSPGPVAVGAAQGASTFGAAYEFAFNMAHQLRKRALSDRCPITFITPEPHLGHFGVGGIGTSQEFVEHQVARFQIEAISNASIRAIRQGELELANQRTLRFAYAMIMPPQQGVDAVRGCTHITDAAGFVDVDSAYQTVAYPEVFAVGAAIAVEPQALTGVPCGVPKTGYFSEQTAKIAAHNVVATLRSENLHTVAPNAIRTKYVLDAGDTGAIMLADRLIEPRDYAWVLPGPEAHWGKVAFEKYFLQSRRHAGA